MRHEYALEPSLSGDTESEGQSVTLQSPIIKGRAICPKPGCCKAMKVSGSKVVRCGKCRTAFYAFIQE